MAWQPNPGSRSCSIEAMLSLAEISDRFEIQQLLIDYSTAIDQRRFDDLDRVFTPDAYIDYRAAGGIDGQFPEVKAWLAEVLPNFPAYSHMLGNFDVRIDGDAASSRTIYFNPMVLNAEAKQVLFIGIWYDDEFVRTPDGWRVRPARRDEVLRQTRVNATLGGWRAGFPTTAAVLAQWAAVCRATTCCSAVTHARQNRIGQVRPYR